MPKTLKTVPIKIETIFLLSLALQLIFIIIMKIPVGSDAGIYHNVAINLIKGGWFSIDGVYPAAGYVKPGYALFLASVYKIFGPSVFAVKIIQSVLISLSCCMVYKIGTELFNQRIGCYSALITTIHPAFLIISSHLLSESLFIFLLSVAILYLIKAFKAKTLKLYVISGIFLGIATQVRFTTIFFPIFILGGLLFSYKEKLYALKAGLVILLMVIITAMPWAIRNYMHFGYLNPFVDYGGVLWLGSYTKGKGHQDNPEVVKAKTRMQQDLQDKYAEKDIGSGKFEVERQTFLLKSAVNNITEDPLGYIGLSGVKIARLWISSYSGLFKIGTPFSEFMRGRSFTKERAFILAWKLFALLLSIAVFCLGVLGMITRFSKAKEVLILYLVVGYFTLLHMVVFANARMGIPVLPYMIIFAISSIFSISKLLRKADI